MTVLSELGSGACVQMSIQHIQLRNFLEREYSKIDLSDAKNARDDQKETLKLTRGLAALSLTYFADASVAEACASVTDESHDHGIDAIFFSRADRALSISQAKWSSTNGTIDSGGVHKFLKGVDDLLNLKKDRFGPKIKRRWDAIEDAVINAKTINLIVAYSSSTPIDGKQREIIDDFLRRVNEGGEIAFIHIGSLNQFFSYIQQGAEGAPIEEEILISNWNLIENPCKGFYGHISASDLARIYSQHSHRVYAKNIRHFLGADTPANEGIITTLNNNPDYFWYFNNGITAIASQIEKKAIGGSSHHSGVFICRDLSIVNGAQTVGSIHSVWQNDPTKTDAAKVPIRIISLENAPLDFDKRITRASNTQNRIDARNFVALDPEQDRLRIELIIDNIEYEYRQSETFSISENSFELNEATIALACTQNDVTLVTLAKGKISSLWADIDSSPYKILFNASLSGPELWTKVKRIRRIGQIVKEIQKNEKEKRKNIAVAGSLFLQHLAYHKVGISDDASEKLIAQVVTRLHEKTCDAVEALYPDSYPGNIFKNADKCRVLKETISQLQTVPAVQ